jgi:hypothetical protein
MMVLIGGSEKPDAVQWEKSVKLRKRDDDKLFEGYVVRRTDDKRSFGDNINQDRVFSDYVIR